MAGREHIGPEIREAMEMPSVSLFDTPVGSTIHLDLSFDEDGGKTGKISLRVDQPAERRTWERGSFTVVDADLSFDSPIGELVGKTGSVDAAVTYRKGMMPPFTLGQIAHITRGRDLIVNFDIPEKPEKVNRWIPFVLGVEIELPVETEPAPEV